MTTVKTESGIEKESYPRYFDCPDLGGTFKALNPFEAEMGVEMGANEVDQLVYEELKKAYSAGHETPQRRDAKTQKGNLDAAA
ncbi:hypothetical protein [Vibrio crassostreae]|uniref:hypothetical protein n=1 Tax=Vibrio crassostreae TaxID=246167 RepID=UPI001B30EF51|nr:hypothetical protein [Vibrio crassostreae]